MKTIERFLIGLFFALVMAGLTLFIAEAQAQPAPAAQRSSSECFTCHQDFQTSWASGAHGHANTDPIFNQEWIDQGKPGACLVCHVTGYDPSTGTWEEDGVSCQACHSPLEADHPNQPMPVERSADLCGRCHSDARFGWQEWQTSAHFQRGMACTVCHDPHAAGLKGVEGLEAQGPSGLCVNCHRDYNMEFPYSIHSRAGLNCVDCHLRHFGASGDRAIHTMPDHSFTANLASCAACHRDQMHGSTEQGGGAQAAASEPLPANGNGQVSGQPSPVSPVGFASIAGLLGLAGGIVLAPWLGKAYRTLNRKGSQP
jgi:predicted CXXCH cytochrome family protein